jgi:tetratricopeptide (TPR) repeat protein
MGIIAAAALLLATQTVPVKNIPNLTASPQASKSRLDEIWDHVDNRIITQSDVWFELGEFPLCVSLLRVQSGYAPDDFDIVTNLGWMLENIERVDDAREVYLDFGNRHKSDPNAMYSLGFSYYNYKRYDDAIKVLEPTLIHNPGPNTYRTLAKSYEKKGQPKDAVRIWELELKKFPNEPTAIANIKRVKAKLGSGGK